MIRFFWLEPGMLAGCSRPGAEDIAADLAALRGHGVGALLSLTETALPADALAEAGIEGLHLPVPDFHPPSPEQFLLALAFLDQARAGGAPAAVHCLAGQGRTGSVLAAWLIRSGQEAPAAIAAVRVACPGAIEAAAQEAALREFARAPPARSADRRRRRPPGCRRAWSSPARRVRRPGPARR